MVGSQSDLPSSSETSASCSAESSPSRVEASATSSLRGAGDDRHLAALLTKHRLNREHRLRRLLSQRRLGDPERAELSGAPAFQMRRDSLRDDDALLLMSFSNAECFGRLTEALARPTGKELPLDRLLAASNTLFHCEYTMPLNSRELTREALIEGFGEDAEMKALAACQRPMNRKRQERSAATRAVEALPRKKKQPEGLSAAGGLVAQSMAQWEEHLGLELQREGDTIQNYRQSRAKGSYVDQARFQQAAQWNEYLRERALQDRQTELEAKRAIRRGEAEP